MEHKTRIGFALREFVKLLHITRTWRWMAGAAFVIVCATLSGCADSPSSTYPSLSKITGLGNILTPEERQKAVQDLEKQEQSHGQTAAKDIQKQ